MARPATGRRGRFLGSVQERGAAGNDRCRYWSAGHSGDFDLGTPRTLGGREAGLPVPAGLGADRAPWAKAPIGRKRCHELARFPRKAFVAGPGIGAARRSSASIAFCDARLKTGGCRKIPTRIRAKSVQSFWFIRGKVGHPRSPTPRTRIRCHASQQGSWSAGSRPGGMGVEQGDTAGAIELRRRDAGQVMMLCMFAAPLQCSSRHC